MGTYRIERCVALPGEWRGVPELVGYVDANDAREALREARREYGSERSIGRLRAVAVEDPSEDESRFPTYYAEDTQQ